MHVELAHARPSSLHWTEDITLAIAAIYTVSQKTSHAPMAWTMAL